MSQTAEEKAAQKAAKDAEKAAQKAAKDAAADPNGTQNPEDKPKDDANAVTKAQDLPAATDTVKVKFLRSHPALAYSPGEVADLPRELHDKYLEDGPFFEAIVETATTE